MHHDWKNLYILHPSNYYLHLISKLNYVRSYITVDGKSPNQVQGPIILFAIPQRDIHAVGDIFHLSCIAGRLCTSATVHIYAKYILDQGNGPVQIQVCADSRMGERA